MDNFLLCSGCLKGALEKSGLNASTLFVPSLADFQEHFNASKVHREENYSIVADLSDSTAIGEVVEALSSIGASCQTAYLVLSKTVSLNGNERLFGLHSGFSSVFIFQPDDTLEDTETCLAHVLMVHQNPEMREVIFCKRNGVRAARAYPLEIPERKELDHGAKEIIRRILFPKAFELSELLLDELRDKLQALCDQISSFGRRHLWVLWEHHIEGLQKLMSSILEGDSVSAESFRYLHQYTEAKLLLAEVISECVSQKVIEQPDFDAIIYGSEVEIEKKQEKDSASSYIPKMQMLTKQAVKLVDYFINEKPGPGIQPGKYTKFAKRSVGSWLIRHTELSSAHLACRRLLVYMLRILDASAFRRNFLIAFLRCVWEEHVKNDANPGRRGDWDLLRSLRRVLQEIRGERVIIAVPDWLLSDWHDHSDQVGLFGAFGQPCEIVTIAANEGWLYSDRPLHPNEILDQTLQAATLRDTSSPTDRPKISSPVDGVARKEEELGEPTAKPCQVSFSPQASREPCPVCGLDSSSPVLRSSIELATGADHKDAPPVSCPKCHRLNTKAWWFCTQHGKINLLVPIDKVRCPDCILRHHKNPIQFPLSSIGVRPGFVEPFPCPCCNDLQKDRPWHKIFFVPEEIVPFYMNGVNGHDSVRFPELAAKFGLLDGYRCPGCATILIPVDHRFVARNGSRCSA